MRGRVPGRADCAGLRRRGNGLRAVERGRCKRRARAHLFFVFHHGRGELRSAKADVSTADDQVEHCFPAITAGAADDVRIAWMDTLTLLRGIFSSAVRTTAAQPGRPRRNSQAGRTASTGAMMDVRPDGSPSLRRLLLDCHRQPREHARRVGRRPQLQSPGSIWYSRGR